MFRKSTYSTESGGNCVEVQHTAALVAVRDSKAVGQGQVRVVRSVFVRFLDGAKGGRFGY